MDKFAEKTDNINKKKYRVFIFYLAIFLFAGLIFPNLARADSLYFSPSSGSYVVGQNFSVNIHVSSVAQVMNAASGAISFPQDKLEVVSLSKSGSIFSLWVQEPSFSNVTGVINFEGIVLDPGFMGSAGKIITVNFKVKAAGNAFFSIHSGSVLANDGKGTNILTSLGNAQFNFNYAGPSIPEAVTPSITLDAPSASQISSVTHPDPNKWYSKNTAKFSWSTPSDVVAVRLSYDKYPNSQPKVVYESAISEKEIVDLKDGVYYFHVQLKNNKGWGGISHFRFQIDTQSPESFTVRFIDGNETFNPEPSVMFSTTDSLSGISYYKIKIGEGDFFSVAPEIMKSNPYALPFQYPGKRSILIQAYDNAGNYSFAIEEFIIKPIEAPIIDKYTEELIEGEALKIGGKTYPEANITIFLRPENGREAMSNETRADKQGNFTLIWSDKLKSGIYTFWAEATDSRGAKSEKSSFYNLLVKQEAFIRIGSSIIDYLTAIISLLVVGLALLFFGWYIWHRFNYFRKRVKKEVREAESALHKAFELLKKDIQEQIKLLERTRTRRQLTEEEEKIIKKLKNNLDNTERLVRKEIEDIEGELK